jgi:hypothetical protein
MNSIMKEAIQLIKDDQALRQKVYLSEELQPVSSDNYAQETNLINEPAMPSTDDELIEGDEAVMIDPNLMLDPALNFESNSIEQKKIMLVDYFDKLLNKVVIVIDHIDSLSFDSVVSSNMVIGTSQLQFNLEELKSKVSKYIEDQYESDKYERALYVYLSFMEELKLIVKLLQKQAKKL